MKIGGPPARFPIGRFGEVTNPIGALVQVMVTTARKTGTPEQPGHGGGTCPLGRRRAHVSRTALNVYQATAQKCRTSAVVQSKSAKDCNSPTVATRPCRVSVARYSSTLYGGFNSRARTLRTAPQTTPGARPG